MNRTARIVFSLFIASMIFYIMGWRAALATFIVTYFAAPPLLGASNKWVKRVPMLISLFLIICCFLLAYPGPAGDNRYKRAKAWVENFLVDAGEFTFDSGQGLHGEAKAALETGVEEYHQTKARADRKRRDLPPAKRIVTMEFVVSQGQWPIYWPVPAGSVVWAYKPTSTATNEKWEDDDFKVRWIEDAWGNYPAITSSLLKSDATLGGPTEKVVKNAKGQDWMTPGNPTLLWEDEEYILIKVEAEAGKKVKVGLAIQFPADETPDFDPSSPPTIAGGVSVVVAYGP